MYKSIVKYVAAATLLLATACNGENHCYPGYQAGESASKEVSRTSIFRGGTQEEVAERHGITIDDFTFVNDMEPRERINFGDTICIPKKRK